MNQLNQIHQVIFYSNFIELRKKYGHYNEFGMKNRTPLSDDLKFSELELN